MGHVWPREMKPRSEEQPRRTEGRASRSLSLAALDLETKQTGTLGGPGSTLEGPGCDALADLSQPQLSRPRVFHLPIA